MFRSYASADESNLDDEDDALTIITPPPSFREHVSQKQRPAPAPRRLRWRSACVPALAAMAVLCGAAAAHRLGALPRLGGEQRVGDRADVPRTAVGRLRVTSSHPGARLVLDGVPSGPLPASFDGVSVGPHEVRVEVDGHRPFVALIGVREGETADARVPALQPVEARVSLEVEPRDAQVSFVSEGPPRLVVAGGAAWPRRASVDPTRAWTLIAQRPGYAPVIRHLHLEPGSEQTTLRVALRPAAAMPIPAPTASEGAAAADAYAADDGPEVAEAGTLDINSLPPSNVLLDGRPLGLTPKVEVPVISGVHTVTFVHPDLGKKSLRVEVKRGLRAMASVRFDG